jgi:hypothetical protein
VLWDARYCFAGKGAQQQPPKRRRANKGNTGMFSHLNIYHKVNGWDMSALNRNAKVFAECE